MGGSPKDYSVLYNESNTVKEISADLFLKSGISGKKKPTKLSVPKKLKEVYERVVNRRYAADRKFPTNMTRAEYYWLTRQEKCSWTMAFRVSVLQSKKQWWKIQ